MEQIFYLIKFREWKVILETQALTTALNFAENLMFKF